MFVVEVYAAVRHFVFVEGNSQRDASRVFGLSRATVSKMCRFSLPPGYRRTVRRQNIWRKTGRRIKERRPRLGIDV